MPSMHNSMPKIIPDFMPNFISISPNFIPKFDANILCHRSFLGMTEKNGFTKQPINHYSATKILAEKATLAANNLKTKVCTKEARGA
jgi:hypothetical protein